MVIIKQFFQSHFLFIIIIFSAVFLLLYRLSELLIFSGDIGWFYLSARDILLGKGIPLVGITASHTWLHQGPFWTYMLAVALWFGQYNPLSGAYLAILFGLITIALVYLIGRQMLSKKIALIASALYATSPLALIHARMPYHISPIPLFTILYFFSIFKWIDGDKKYFPFAFLFLAILYNFELATVMLLAPLILIIGYGIWRKTVWIRTLREKDLGLAVLAGVIPMIPVILYDMTHGYKQTVVYGGWLVYNALRSLGLPFFSRPPVTQPINIFQFTSTLLQRLLFLPSGIVALLILIGACMFAGYSLYQQVEAKKINKGFLLVLLWFVCSTIIYFGNKTPSEAYVPVLFPAIFFLVAYSIAALLQRLRLVGLLVLLVLMGLNVSALLSHNYLVGVKDGYGPTFSDREETMRTILNTVHGGDYRLIGLGNGSQFQSFLMPYEYLGWYYGNPPSKNKGQTFIIEEKDTGITLLQRQKTGD